MSYIICTEAKDCPICSHSFFSYIHTAALHKDYDYIETILNKRKLYRKNVLDEKLKNLKIDIERYNYKEMRTETENFIYTLEFFGVDGSNSFSTNVDILIEVKDWHLLNFYYNQEDSNDDWVINFCIKEALKERDRRSEKFLKRFFKQNPQFKEVSERKGCHSLLFFNPADTKKILCIY